MRLHRVPANRENSMFVFIDIFVMPFRTVAVRVQGSAASQLQLVPVARKKYLFCSDCLWVPVFLYCL